MRRTASRPAPTRCRWPRSACPQNQTRRGALPGRRPGCRRRFCPGKTAGAVCITHAVVSRQGGVGEAEFVDEHLVGVVGAIAIGVLVDGDAAAAGVWCGGGLGWRSYLAR